MASNSWRQDREEEEDAEDELDEADYKTQKDAVLFVVDVSKSMLEAPPKSSSRKADQDSPVAAALKCAYHLMQQRIIASPKDLMGIMLFGTEKTKFREGDASGSGYPHCYLLVDLDVPAAEDVRQLKALADDGDDPDGVLTPTSETVKIANVLFCANQVFTTNAPNFGSRRLFIITDNDDPHHGDKLAQTTAATRAKDLYDLGVMIELFPISRGDEKFDLSKFYDDIIYRNPAEADSPDSIKSSRSGDGLNLLGSLISNINSKQTPKRAYFSHLPFEIAPGLNITVKGYIPLHAQKPARSCYIFLDDEKAQIATGETTKVEVETARTVDKTELKKAYKFGGEYVYFSPDETKKLKDWGGHVLRIIGFKPRSALPLWASVKKSTFIFPSEEDFVGSTRVFTALWKKLLRDNKMALAWFVARVNANPILVAILPSKPQHDEESGTNFLPAGLWLYPLPFADDIRELPDRNGIVDAPEDIVDKMSKVVQNLLLPKSTYNPTRYPNPALQWHYKILQTLALEDEVPTKPEDATVPKYKAIANRVGDALVELNGDIAAAASDVAGQRSLKRELDTADDDGAPPAKKSRGAAAGGRKAAADATGGGMSNAQLKARFEEGTLLKMTVVELKDILTSKGVSTTGKKADLVERLEEWIESNT